MPTTAPVRWQRWFIPAFAATLVADLASKQLVFATWAVGEQPLPFIYLAKNKGVAWSLFAEHPWFVTLLSLVLVPALAVFWWRTYRLAGAWENLAFGLILGGALGNVADRVAARLGWLGGVRDFIHVDLGFPPFDPWPTFNLADSGICVGFAIVFLLSFRRPAPASPA